MFNYFFKLDPENFTKKDAKIGLTFLGIYQVRNAGKMLMIFVDFTEDFLSREGKKINIIVVRESEIFWALFRKISTKFAINSVNYFLSSAIFVKLLVETCNFFSPGNLEKFMGQNLESHLRKFMKFFRQHLIKIFFENFEKKLDDF